MTRVKNRLTAGSFAKPRGSAEKLVYGSEATRLFGSEQFVTWGRDIALDVSLEFTVRTLPDPGRWDTPCHGWMMKHFAAIG